MTFLGSRKSLFKKNYIHIKKFYEQAKTWIKGSSCYFCLLHLVIKHYLMKFVGRENIENYGLKSGSGKNYFRGVKYNHHQTPITGL